MSFLQIIF